MYPFVNYYKIVNVILKEVSILSWAAQSRFWEKMVENCFFYTDIWWIKNKRLKLIDEIWWYSNRCQLKLRPVCRVSNRNSVARNCADLHATVLELRASKINLRWKPPCVMRENNKVYLEPKSILSIGRSFDSLYKAGWCFWNLTNYF